MTPILSVPMTVEVPWDVVTNAFTGAVEGPYTPWVHRFTYIREQPSMGLAEAARGGEHTVWYNDPAFWTGGGKALLRYDLPDKNEGNGRGELVVSTEEIQKGLAAMAQKAPRHFADLIGENDDAITHDVFMQMIVFGEIIYG